MITAIRSVLRTVCLLSLIFCLAGTAYAAAHISYAAGSGNRAEGLNVPYRIGDPLPGLITASVTSNLGTVPFGYSSSAAWIQVTASDTQTPATLQIQINPTGMTVGTYTGTLTVTTTVLDSGKVVDWRDVSTITLTITPAPVSTPSVLPGSLSFTGATGQPVAPQTLLLTSSPSSLAYTATATQPWIGISSATGVTGAGGATLSVSINTSLLSAGTSSGQINISLPGGTPSTILVPISVSLLQAATDIVPPSVNLTGTAQQGSAAVLLGAFSPVGSSTASLGFTVAVPAAASGWLSAQPSTGVTPAAVQVYASAQNLQPGTYSANLQVTLSNANPANYNVPVSFTVTAPPPVVFASSISSFDLAISVANPTSNSTVPVTISATQGTTSVSSAFTVATDQSWLKAVPSSGTTPATLTISADASASPLSAGSYTGNVTISSGGAVQLTIRVGLNVASASVAVFSTQQVTLATVAGSRTSTSGSVAVNVTSQSVAPVGYRVSSSVPWLTLGGALTGTVAVNAPITLAIDVDGRTLAAGQRTGTLTLETLSTLGVTIGTDTAIVNVVVSAPPAELVLDQNLIRLSAVSGAAASQLATLGITTGSGTTAFTVTKTSAWLSVTPVSGQGAQTLALKVDPSKLGPGDYADTITVSGPTTQVTTNVQLTVVAPGALTFTPSPATVSLTTYSNIPQPPSTAVTLSGLDRGALGSDIYQWRTTVSTVNGGQWLAAALDTTSFPFTVTIFASPSSLTAGTYTGMVSVVETAGSTIQRDIPVTFTIQSPVQNSYALAVQSINDQEFTGTTTPFTQTVGLAPKLLGLSFTTQVVMDNGSGWLSVANATGTTMPATVDVLLTPTSLTAGIYTGRVTFTATAGAGVVIDSATQSVTVRLVVKDPPPPVVTVLSSSPVSYMLTAGSGIVSPGISPLVTLGYTSSGFATATVSSSATWLRFSAPSYNVTSDGVTIFASVDPGAAPSVAGTYSATYAVNGPNGVVTQGSVTLLVLAGVPAIALTPEASSIVVTAGSFNTRGSTVTLQNTGASSVDFGVSLTSSGWLGIANGVNGGTLAPNQTAQIIAYAAGNLVAGNYFGSITVTATNGTANVQATHQVVLQVQAPDLSGVNVEQPTSKSGPADGSALTYTINITNPTVLTLPFVVSSTSLTTAAGGLAALSISPNTGNLGPNSNQVITITAKAPTSAGLYGNAILLFINGAAYQREAIYAAQAAAGSTCNVTKLIPLIQKPSDQSNLPGSLPVVITAVISDNCGSPFQSGTVTAGFSNGDKLVTLRSPGGDGLWQGTWVPTSSTNPQVQITVTAQDSSGVGQGTAQRTVFVSATAGVPTIDAGGIVNASDFGAPNIAQSGSYISISGQNLASGVFSAPTGTNLPTLLGDTQVVLAGTPMGLSAASPTSITAFVPFGLPINFSLPLQVVRGQLASVPQNLHITDKNPALFLASSDPSRPGLFVVTRGTTSFQVDTDNPAKAGDILTATASGLGWTDANGKVTGTVVVTIGGVAITPTSAVLAPSLLGVYQLTLTIPAGIAAGNEVPVTVSVDSQPSNPVTIAIR